MAREHRRTLRKIVGPDQRARHPPLDSERRNERHEDDEPRVDHQAGDFGNAADVLHAVGFRESEIFVESMTHVVAVEQVRVPPHDVESLFDEVRDRRLAGARESGEPDYARLLTVEVLQR